VRAAQDADLMRVLLVARGFPPDACGGAETYVADLASALVRCGDDVTVLARDPDPARHDVAVRRERRGALDLVLLGAAFRGRRGVGNAGRHRALPGVAAQVIDEFQPDVAHVHHLSGLPTDVVPALGRRRVPVVFTLHDYWLLCHRGQLLDLDGRPCTGPPCGRCLDPALAMADAARGVTSRAPALAARLPGGIRRALAGGVRAIGRGSDTRRAARRRAEQLRSITAGVARFLAPSEWLRDRFVAAGFGPERIVHHPQGIDLARFPPIARTRGPRVRLGYVGTLMLSKAPHLVLEAFRALPVDRASLTLVGPISAYHGDERYPAALAALIARPGVRHLGALPPADIPHALAGMDVLVVPSVWPENAPRVIQEAFASGMPVVAAAVGGIPEMVRDGVSGLLFPPGDVAALRRHLLRLLDEPALLSRLRTGVPDVRSIDEDAAWTRALYGEVAGRRPRAGPAFTSGAARGGASAFAAVAALARHGEPGARHPASVRVSAVVVDHGTPEDTWLAVRSLESSRRSLDEIVLVDNGSPRGPLALPGRPGPRVTVLTLRHNGGFTGGANAGVRHALAGGADHVLLVNSDAIVPPDTVDRLLEALDAVPTAGIAGPVLVSRAHPERVTSLGIAYAPATGRMRHLGHAARYDPAALRPAHVVDAVSGCVMLVRRAVFEQVGLLDDAYFFSFEDLDLCLRARAAGWATVLAGQALVYHEGGRTLAPASPRRIYFATRNHLRLARRAAPAHGRGAAILRDASVAALNLAHVLFTAGVPRAAGIRAFLRGVRDHVRGRYGSDGPGDAGPPGGA
jgi:GT2 family glycosyltransferase/glycosyltransferase involved in cell wall biosynthesis